MAKKTNKKNDDLNINYISTEKLVPYANNARTHSDQQIKQIADSIGEFGFTNPVLIDEKNGVIAGHGRIMAAQLLKLDTIPTIKLSGLSDAQKKAYIIADNQLALNAGWDLDLLRSEFVDLQDMDFDTDLLGFSDEQMSEIFPDVNTGLTDEDDVPEPPEEPKTKLGDVYILGRHRLVCGDSTKIEDVEKLMDGQKAELLFTSPPYSDMREYNGNKDLSVDNIVNFINVYQSLANYQVINLGIQRKEHSIVQYWDSYIEKAKGCGYKFLSWNVWCKPSAGSIGNQSAFFPICHEWIFVFGYDFKDINRTEEKKTTAKKNRKVRKVRQPDGSMSESSVGRIEEFKELGSWLELTPELGKIRSEHPATFPVLLPEKYIISITNINNNVIEPFGGSGSTLIACEKTNRNCYMMELDERYCDVIVKRWEDYTGQKSELIS